MGAYARMVLHLQVAHLQAPAGPAARGCFRPGCHERQGKLGDPPRLHQGLLCQRARLGVPRRLWLFGAGRASELGGYHATADH